MDYGRVTVYCWRERCCASMILYMKNLTLPIIVEPDSDGYFVPCPALQRCYSQGDTHEEAVLNIKDAIRLHLEDRV